MPSRRTPPPAMELIEFLRPYPREVAELFFAARALVLDVAPESSEVVWDAYNAVAVGFGYTDKRADQFCHIAAYSKHVNLGLNQGAHFPDPHGILEGTGNQVRHISLRTMEDVRRSEVRQMVEHAHAEANRPAGAKRQEPVIRRMESGRKRPS